MDTTRAIMDVNNDGVIDYNEFVKYLLGQAASAVPAQAPATASAR